MSKMNANALEQCIICVGYKNFVKSKNISNDVYLSIIYVYLGYIDRKVMNFAPVMHQ